jgi:hypothetical protein
MTTLVVVVINLQGKVDVHFELIVVDENSPHMWTNGTYSIILLYVVTIIDYFN